MSGFYLANGQTHMLIGSASDIATVGNDYYSWSIGEVIVFNDDNRPEFMAQSMQSYINPPKEDCFTINVSSANSVLCTDVNSLTTTLTYSISKLPLTKYDTVQWYFGENETGVYSKIVGATDTTNKIYKPYFPGYYKLCAVSNALNCKICSGPVPVKLSNTIGNPYIIPDGSPAKILTFVYSPGPDITVQWYAYIPVLKKYLLIVGANQPVLKVRYDGDYMAMVLYGNDCKLSAASGVSGYNKPLYRATDTKIDGNNIYIPEETAYAHSALKVFPNPAINSFTIQYESSSELVSKAQLYSSTGLSVKEIKFNEGDNWSKTAIVNAEDLSAGVYFLKINEGDRQMVEKVVLQK
ncbi:MAG: T9SS type A sorting domain-containing protein [Opitutaceae bacterium]|nr:T9SS type A sorting domain-containing protein [Cytophagales bacterium]